jgi:predicted short-subunit dehydrogenase-like oxidoreductase (DUF2520 family)
MNHHPTIAIVGLGNVGWNLARGLHACDYRVEQIVSRDPSKDRVFLDSIGAVGIPSMDLLDRKVDLIFMCTPDDTTETLTSGLNHSATLVHCSGSVPVLRDTNSGVFYAFQTFTKHVEVEWEGIPIFIETEHPEVYQLLERIGKKLSGNVRQVNEMQRKHIHISGVFGANFVNHILYQAKRVLDRSDLPFEVLEPLLHEVIRKAFTHGPMASQTGPARRGDVQLMEKHLEALESDQDLHELYACLSEGIQSIYRS